MRQFPCTLRVRLRPCGLRRNECVVGKKLPFAGYSVVKDHSGGNIAPRNLSVIAERFPPDPHRSLTRGAPMPHSVRSRQSLGLRPEPRLGRSRGPRRPAPLPRSSLTCVRSLRRNTHSLRSQNLSKTVESESPERGSQGPPRRARRPAADTN